MSLVVKVRYFDLEILAAEAHDLAIIEDNQNQLQNIPHEDLNLSKRKNFILFHSLSFDISTYSNMRSL